MKISKFNENQEKYWKPIIKWDEDKLDQLEIMKNKVEVQKEEIISSLDEYLSLNADIFEEFTDFDPEYGHFNCYNFIYYKYPQYMSSNIKYKMKVDFDDGDEETNTLYIKEEKFPDFLNFLNNPQMYKQSKKYNL